MTGGVFVLGASVRVFGPHRQNPGTPVDADNGRADTFSHSW